MALDFTNITPTRTVMPADTRGRQAVDRGPNPFLDEGWLRETYDSGEGAEITVAGALETYEGTIRATKETVTKRKLTGDAAEAVRMIREAADKLGLGVRVVTTVGGPGVKDNQGRAVRKGMVLVQYLGQTRKAPRKTKSE